MNRSRNDLVAIEVPSDGNCLFSAIFLAFYQKSKGDLIKADGKKFKAASDKLRATTVDYILENWDCPLGDAAGNLTGQETVAFEYMSDPECTEISSQETYQNEMQRTHVFAGETELLALSAVLNCGIVVHIRNCLETVYYNTNSGAADVQRRRNPERRAIIHVEFEKDSKHYKALVPTVV
jgi:hypothetical protein